MNISFTISSSPLDFMAVVKLIEHFKIPHWAIQMNNDGTITFTIELTDSE